MSTSTPRILHLHSSFDPGGKEVRCARLINAFGKKAEHAIVSGDPDRRDAARLLDRKTRVSWPQFPSLRGKPFPNRLKKLAEAMSGYDLICTYNWGAMDAVMAHTLFADVYKLPPLVHHEDGFNEDEAEKLKWQRNLYRRIALGRSAALIVPSKKLEDIALGTWSQPRSRVRFIPNAIDTLAFSAQPKRDALPNLIKRKGEYWVGSLAGLRKVKNLNVLVRAVAYMPKEWHLVIAGEGSERASIQAEAVALGIEDRVHLPGFVDNPQKIVGLFDIFALSSQSEQAPISVIEAMAAGIPIASPRVGDVPSMVSSDNGPFLSEIGDEGGLRESLEILAANPADRKRIGAANREKARAEFDELRMVERYKALYWGLMGRKA